MTGVKALAVTLRAAVARVRWEVIPQQLPAVMAVMACSLLLTEPRHIMPVEVGVRELSQATVAD
jgi:hypothetical protein